MDTLPAGLAEALFGMCPLPIMVADAEGRVTHANPAAAGFCGYSTEELRTLLHVSDLYHRIDDARAVMRAAKEDIGESLEVVLRLRGGELVPCRIHARMLRDASGGFAGTVGVIEDRREVIELSRRLEDVTGQVVASEKRAAVIALSAQAAHELSQPLMAAMGNIELALMDAELEARLANRLRKTYSQLERMKGIVGDFVRLTATRTLPPE
jgi:PAS domain S-box-containing protein